MSKVARSVASMWQGIPFCVCQDSLMADKNLRFTPLSPHELKPEEERFLTRVQLCQRWGGCSEKAVLRAENRLGLRPCRILRGIRYPLSDILRIETQGFGKMPKKFTGLRPDQKAELLRREREEVATPTRAK
jgi:hypothetical protein